MRCGACCAFYRISFNSRETTNFPGGEVPLNLTFKVNATRSAMKGTGTRPIRCQALSGEIGRSVYCTIYDHRPTTCREFLNVWENDVVNSLCDRARATYGLMPISNF